VPILPGPKTAARKPAPELNAGTSNLTRGDAVSAKPINSLGTAIAKAGIVGVTALAEVQKREFPIGGVFTFGPLEETTDILKDKDNKVIFPYAGRILSPYSPFKIVDNDDPEKPVYPSILHYLAAMEYVKATNRGDLAKSLFSETGTIHSTMLEKMLLKKKDGEVPEPVKQQLLVEEAAEVLANNPTRNIRKYNLQYNEGVWLGLRDTLMKNAYEERYKKDINFRMILGKLKEMEKYLLYRPTERQTSNLGGISKFTGRGASKKVKVEGENKLGVLLMTIADFPGYKIETVGANEEE
jgi:hypothetical protein